MNTPFEILLLARVAGLRIFQRASDRLRGGNGNGGLGNFRRRPRTQVVGRFQAFFQAYIYMEESLPMFGLCTNKFRIGFDR